MKSVALAFIAGAFEVLRLAFYGAYGLLLLVAGGVVILIERLAGRPIERDPVGIFQRLAMACTMLGSALLIIGMAAVFIHAGAAVWLLLIAISLLAGSVAVALVLMFFDKRGGA